MKKLVILFYILGLSMTSIYAQNNFVVPDSTNQIVFNAIGGVGSTKLPQAFLNKFIFPDYINNELKDAASEQLSSTNLFGGELGGNLTALINFKRKEESKTQFFYGLSLGTQFEGNLNFTKDFFNLVFYGNQPFSGQSLSLNETSFKSISYSYIEGSYGFKRIQKTGNSSIWIDAALLVGHGFSDFEVGSGSIFTEENGDYIDIRLKESSLERSDSVNTSLNKGLGSKFDIHYARQSSSYTFLCSVENIGRILWNNVTHANLDTTFSFEGIEVGDIFQFSDSVLNQVSSVDSFVETQVANKFKSLPLNISLYYNGQFEKFEFDLFLKHRFLVNYTPFFRAGLYLKSSVFSPGATIAYGGYSGFQAGINGDLYINKSIKLQVGTNNILGAMFPNQSSALDIYTGLKFSF